MLPKNGRRLALLKRRDVKEARMRETAEVQSPPKISRGSLVKARTKVGAKTEWKL